jgi:tripartite-type tricarboxylate transporter receptor subunit TctC
VEELVPDRIISGVASGILAALLIISASGCAAAQEWPTHPIVMVVPFVAGGSIDIPARRLAAELTLKLGQQVVVENRSGANGNIGGAYVAKASPDGYTLMFAPPGVLTTNRFIYKETPFDADRAFAPVALLAKSPLVLAANPELPLGNLVEVIAYAKANPGKLSAGTPGIGSQGQLALELLRSRSGARMSYVPYRGASASSTDVLAGRIDLSINFTPAMIGPLQEGALRGLAVTSTQRSKQLPGVPTVAECGFPGFEAVASYSLVVPSGTPHGIVMRLNQIVNDYIRSDAGRQQLEQADMQAVGGSPQDLQSFIANEVEKWGPIIKAADIHM